MKDHRFLKSLRHIVAAVLAFASVSAFGAPAAAESSVADARLSQLVDSARYSSADKEALKSGLSVALPGAATEYVSQKTIDLQAKSSTASFRDAVTLVVNVADHLDAKAHEFTRSDAFQRVDAGNRATVKAFLNDVVEQYRSRAFEALLSRYNRSVSLPANVPKSVENADYRALLDVAVKAALLSPESAAEAPAVVAQPVEAEKPATVAESAAAEKPVVAEKSAEAEKPVVVEKAAEAPVTTENAIETPVIATKPVEKPATAEKSAQVRKPAPGTDYALTVGDSIALLARLNKIPPAAIVDANPGLIPTRMHVGQVIVIPTMEWVNAWKPTPQPKDAPLLSSK
jgi:LysM repeat protein